MNDWHFVHLGHLAYSGAGLMILEATHVTREGRITHRCSGLYDAHNEAAMKRVIDNCRRLSKNPIGVQIGIVRETLPHTGFQRMVAGKSVLIADTGAPPPHGLDRHAHAGTLSFEFSHGGERMIVNCGAHPIAPEWRQVQRATAAHSALVVDDTNSSMLLPVGGLALAPRSVVVRREATEAGQWLDARHNGYEEPFDLTHRRRLFLTPDGLELIGEETLTGRGGRTFALRFHLHPAVQVTMTQSSQSAILKLPQGGGWRELSGPDLR